MINQSTFLHPPPENPHLSFPRSSTGDHSGSSNSKFTADEEEEEHFFSEDLEFAAEKKRREQFCRTPFPRSTVLTVSVPGSVADTHR